MINIDKPINKACYFHDVNQWDEEKTRYLCSIYFWFINAKYNWAIKHFTEDDIKEVAQLEVEKGLLDYKKWWVFLDGIKAVHQWLLKKWYNCHLWWWQDDNETNEWINKWYAVWVWLGVNSRFYKDKLDGQLDNINYNKYKWDIWHSTNIIKWNCRGTMECSDLWKEYILDSYFVKSCIYNCNIQKVLEKLAMNTKYIIF